MEAVTHVIITLFGGRELYGRVCYNFTHCSHFRNEFDLFIF